MQRIRLASATGMAALLAGSCAVSGSAPLDPAAYEAALDDRAAFRSELISSCSQLRLAEEVIAEAIAIGAPIYNAGSPLGCFRIYEGAAYKVLVRVGHECPDLDAFLRAGLAKAESDRSIADKAWTMRRTFDAILGEPTSYVREGKDL